MYQKELSLDLNSIIAVKEFAGVASKSTCKVDVTDQHYLVNGKSVMGLFSLNLSEPVTVHLSAFTILEVENTCEKLKMCSPICEVATNEL